MKKYLQNWKTTSAGIILMASGITMFINDHTAVTESLSAILGGFGLIFAADSQKINTPS